MSNSNSNSKPTQTHRHLSPNESFTTLEEVLEDAFASKHIGSIKSHFVTSQLATPPAQRVPFDINAIANVSYLDVRTSTYYDVTRFIGLELFLPVSERTHFRNNRASHAALDYLSAACHIYDQYQSAQRYAHEKEIFMNWNMRLKMTAQQYRVTPDDVANNLRAAFSVVALLKPHFLPVPPEILAFEEQHNVSRKRGIIFGIN